MKSYLALTWKELKAVSYTHLDDELQGESNSISNQKKMLEDFARRNGLPNPTPVSYTHLDVYKRQD